MHAHTIASFQSSMLPWIRTGLRASSATRRMSSANPLIRPGPPPLPRAEQREFDELVRAAQTPLQSSPGRTSAQAEQEALRHPDARAPIVPEFEGDTNPVTGEKGGPKREPVRRWGESDGDWSFKGRVSDF